jgi:L-iditol 2-dehydrogenase
MVIMEKNNSFGVAVLHSPSNISFEERKMDRDPGPNEVLLRVRYSGICSSDIKRVMEPGGAYVYPLVPGHEFSGEVVNLGSSVTGFSIGEKVGVFPLMRCGKCRWCKNGMDSLCDNYDYLGSRRDGGFSQYVFVPSSNLIKLGSKVTLKDASLIEPAAVAYHGTVKAKNSFAGGFVLVYGLGTVGLFAVQFAKLLGAKKVIGVDRNSHKFQIAKKCGADYTISPDSIQSGLAELGFPDGPDVFLECAGSAEAQANSIEIVKKSGEIVFLGNSKGDLVIKEKTVPRILRKEVTIKGSWNSFFDSDWKFVVDAMDSGKIMAEELVSHEFPLSEVSKVFHALKERSLKNVIKVTFVP